jgi:hypothetical protein
MPSMRAVEVRRAGGRLERVEREIPEPKRGEVRVRVEACGKWKDGGAVFESGRRVPEKDVEEKGRGDPYQAVEKCLPEAVQEVPDARQAKSRGMRRTFCTLNDEG